MAPRRSHYVHGVFDTLLNPKVIMEVLSESTEEYDRGPKFEHYRKVPSVQEYALVAQDRPYIEKHVRRPDNSWTKTELSDMALTLAFSTIPVQIPLAEIYRGVEFPGK
jgi:Uma2 family endonuclease